MLTQEYLKSILHYDPETGIFTWLKCSRKGNSGKIAGNKSNGYNRIRINKKLYRAHRLAFLYCFGCIPKYIDHINRDTTDNRISNLRGCTQSQNMANTPTKGNNTSGFRGVSWHKNMGQWRADICHHGKQHSLGHFSDPEAAHEAYKKAHVEAFGEFSPFFSAG